MKIVGVLRVSIAVPGEEQPAVLTTLTCEEIRDAAGQQLLTKPGPSELTQLTRIVGLTQGFVQIISERGLENL